MLKSSLEKRLTYSTRSAAAVGSYHDGAAVVCTRGRRPAVADSCGGRRCGRRGQLRRETLRSSRTAGPRGRVARAPCKAITMEQPWSVLVEDARPSRTAAAGDAAVVADSWASRESSSSSLQSYMWGVEDTVVVDHDSTIKILQILLM